MDLEFYGKVFGLENNVNNIVLFLFLVLVGVVESLFGLILVLLFLVVVAIVGGILSWYINENSFFVVFCKEKGFFFFS